MHHPRARAVGMDVTYEGIRMTPEEIVASAVEKKAHAVGLSILSGSHLDLVRDVVARMRAAPPPRRFGSAGARASRLRRAEPARPAVPAPTG